MPTPDELADALFMRTRDSRDALASDYRVVSHSQLRTLAREAAKQALNEAADEIDRVMNDPDRMRPSIGEFSTDKPNDIAWAQMIIRARAEQIGKDSE